MAAASESRSRGGDGALATGLALFPLRSSHLAFDDIAGGIFLGLALAWMAGPQFAHTNTADRSKPR